jgi:DNA-binding response OmpR family regulator
MDEYVAKPIRANELMQRIEAALGMSGQSAVHG